MPLNISSAHCRSADGAIATARRQGIGNGRIYIAEITAMNAYGSVVHRRPLAVVPHDSSADSLNAVLAEAAAGIAPYEHGLSAQIGPKQ